MNSWFTEEFFYFKIDSHVNSIFHEKSTLDTRAGARGGNDYIVFGI